MALLAGCAADFPFRGEVASVSLQTEPNRNTFAIFPSLPPPPPRPPPTPLQWPRLIQNKRSPTEKESRAWKILLDVNCKKENQFGQYICIFSVLHMRLRIRKIPKICYHIRLLNGFVEKCMHFLEVKCICMPTKLSSSVHIYKRAESAVVLQRLSRSIREQSLCLQLHGCSGGYFWTTDGSR